MYKRVILLLLILGLIAIFFIPIAQQKVIRVKAPFLNVYSELSQGGNWENWRPDLKKIRTADSNKISIQKDSTSFTINYPDGNLDVKTRGNSFAVNEHDNKSTAYDYSILPDTNPRVTVMIVNKNISLARYLVLTMQPLTFSDTHADDFKKFMETDSLFYGYAISKIKVPGDNLIVMRKTVLTASKFSEALKMFNTLQLCAKSNNAKPVQPVIGQFIEKSKDSTQLDVGIFIDKEVKPGKNGISFERMPKTGSFYAAKFKGKFFEREKAYSAIRQYFTNHLYQIPIQPFETYLDNKLPTSDTDKIDIRINFPTY